MLASAISGSSSSLTIDISSLSALGIAYFVKSSAGFHESMEIPIVDSSFFGISANIPHFSLFIAVVLPLLRKKMGEKHELQLVSNKSHNREVTAPFKTKQHK